MTSIIPQKFIKINMQETVRYQRKLKENRWLGYNVKIIKDSQDAYEALYQIQERKDEK